ncbi:hypothetical protein ACVMB0_004541 [Bradyrhizobium sp. USDA 4451]
MVLVWSCCRPDGPRLVVAYAPVAEKHGLSECLSEVLHWGYGLRRCGFGTASSPELSPRADATCFPGERRAPRMYGVHLYRDFCDRQSQSERSRGGCRATLSVRNRCAEHAVRTEIQGGGVLRGVPPHAEAAVIVRATSRCSDPTARTAAGKRQATKAAPIRGSSVRSWYSCRSACRGCEGRRPCGPAAR